MKREKLILERTSAFCGNQIREPGEECDCGFTDRDCQQMADKCCQPHEIGGRYLGSGACKRYPGAQCSPSGKFIQRCKLVVGCFKNYLLCPNTHPPKQFKNTKLPEVLAKNVITMAVALMPET